MGRNHRDYRRLFLAQILSRENAGRKEVAMIIESLCADDTFAFGKKLGEAAEPGTVYTLVGDLALAKPC